MKGIFFNNSTTTSRWDYFKLLKITPLLTLMLLIAGYASAAPPPPIIPEVAVRFTNPVFECPTENYCLDVEFKCENVPDQIIYGVNVRFMYDDDILEYLGMSDFHMNYEGQTIDVVTYPPQVSPYFGFDGPVEWVNATVTVNTNQNPLYLTSQWVKLFKVCFHVDDPNSLSLLEFCPSVVWDRKLNPPPPDEGNSGVFPGDDGVVITVVDQTYMQDSSPTDEIVVQFNWEYDQTEQVLGWPVPIECVTTICGYIIPVSNWALFLGIALMVITTIIIYRRRIS
jgi:hypothetical protein